MKYIFCGYRAWAIHVYVTLSINDRDRWMLATTTEEFKSLVEQFKHEECTVICAGWSWLIPSNIIDDHLVVGLHPSRLPDYAGGSPIQHQVLDGVIDSAVTLFKLTNDLDAGPIIDIESISLCGHMHDILKEISRASITLLQRFIRDWPDIVLTQQSCKPKVRKRLKPSDSKLSKSDIEKKSCAQLYDIIRCREDPYPNVYIEDDTGTLVFKQVEFIAK